MCHSGGVHAGAAFPGTSYQILKDFETNTATDVNTQRQTASYESHISFNIQKGDSPWLGGSVSWSVLSHAKRVVSSILHHDI